MEFSWPARAPVGKRKPVLDPDEELERDLLSYRRLWCRRLPREPARPSRSRESLASLLSLRGDSLLTWASCTVARPASSSCLEVRLRSAFSKGSCGSLPPSPDPSGLRPPPPLGLLPQSILGGRCPSSCERSEVSTVSQRLRTRRITASPRVASLPLPLADNTPAGSGRGGGFTARLLSASSSTIGISPPRPLRCFSAA